LIKTVFSHPKRQQRRKDAKSGEDERDDDVETDVEAEVFQNINAYSA
jgi:hypothetical protein